MSTLESQRVALARHSVQVILANQAASGAYMASPNFRVYRYSWFRDGAFIADAMSRTGNSASAEAFVAWCARVLSARSGRIESLIIRHRTGAPIDSNEFLHARYTLEGEEATEEWWNFQLDGYGTWLWAFGVHLGRGHPARPHIYKDGIELSARYLIEFWNVPSYDWWEEHADHRHTSTLAAIAAGLRQVSMLEFVDTALRRSAHDVDEEIRHTLTTEAHYDGRLAKWLGGDSIDASLVSCGVPFGVFPPDDPLMVRTVGEIERRLGRGGVHRYPEDTYYGGGEWPLLSAMLGWHYVQTGRREEAFEQLDWIVRHATSSGDIPEQVADNLLAPAARQAWVDRWGPVASPLLWSHAMYLTLASELEILPADFRFDG